MEKVTFTITLPAIEKVRVHKVSGGQWLTIDRRLAAGTYAEDVFKFGELKKAMNFHNTPFNEKDENDKKVNTTEEALPLAQQAYNDFLAGTRKRGGGDGTASLAKVVREVAAVRAGEARNDGDAERETAYVALTEKETSVEWARAIATEAPLDNPLFADVQAAVALVIQRRKEADDIQAILSVEV